MSELHKGYYNYPFVPEVLSARLAAIRSVLPQGTRLIDLGCNDGTISKALLESGHAARVTGIDFEDVRIAPPAEFNFIAGDLRTFDLNSLPEADIVLCLNVAHHLCLHGIDFTRRFLAALAAKAGAVLLDMGSLSARLDPGFDDRWLQALRAAWQSDAEGWADLFQPFTARRALLTYPFQNGHRVLWKLTGAREPAYIYEVVEGRILRRRDSEELFWVKSYPENERLNDLHEELRKAPYDCILPLAHDPEYGAIYPYDPEIAAGPGLSFSECLRSLSPADFLEVRRFASQPIAAFNNLPFDRVCDFRVRKTARGLTFFHFDALK